MAGINSRHVKESPETVFDKEDINTLSSEIKQLHLKVIDLEEILEELRIRFDETAEDHKKQVDLRRELFRQIMSLVETKDIRIADCGNILDGTIEDSILCVSQRVDQLQTRDTDNALAELKMQINRQCEELRKAVDTHQRLSYIEPQLLQQLQTVIANKDASLLALETQLSEAYERLQQVHAESAEKDILLNQFRDNLKQLTGYYQAQLKVANSKIEESKVKIDQLNANLIISRTELLSFKKLSSETKLRQLKEIEESHMTEGISALMSRLQEEAATLAACNEEHDSVMARDNSQKADETGELDSLNANSSGSVDYLQRLKENYRQVIEMLEPWKVAAFMFQQGAMTLKELQYVQNSYRTSLEASEYVLKIVFHVGKPELYVCFMSALQETSQEHIWSCLTHVDYDINIDSEHVQLIQRNYLYLMNTMDTHNSSLIALLYSKGVIDGQDKDYIETEISRIQRNDKLLSTLRRKPKQKFDLFLEALRGTGQGHVVNKLLTIEYSPDVPSYCAIESSDMQCYLPAMAELHEIEFPTLTHVICGTVTGLTSVGNLLFVLRYPSKQQIEVYSLATFVSLKTLQVHHIRDECYGMTSCAINNCLYISVFQNGTVCKVDLTDVDEMVCKKWRVGHSPYGLSVNSAHDVIVVCEDTICAYTTHGCLVRKILLSSVVTSPFHAIQLTSGHFVVSHWGPVNGVSEVDSDGQLVASFRNNESTAESTPVLNTPYHLSVDEKNEFILVADSGNNRILMLDSSLKCSRGRLVSVESPYRFYLHEASDRLYVGTNNGNRVLVFDNVRVGDSRKF